jgi:CheY-like chemotaxis protein
MVRDTGVGIAADAQARIFGEFEQGDGEVWRRFGGSGLGLAICRRLVERMGGAIGITSTPGAGATFAFTVPLTAVGEDQAVESAIPDFAGMRVLIVSPGPFEGALLAQRLRDWGAEACVATDAAIASACVAAEAWNVLLVDLALGLPAASSLAASACKIERRIVLLAPSARHELAGLTAAGFTDYLIRPVRTASLAARLRADPTDAAADAREALAGLERPEGLSILIAEDNEINALLTRTLLTKLGHRPTLVTGGEAAVTAWQAARGTAAPYGLVLMDVHMPGMDGLEATRRIRDLEAARGWAPTPIIALTANAFAEDRDACLEAGMTGFLTKPLERERLADVLAAVPAAALAA